MRGENFLPLFSLVHLQTIFHRLLHHVLGFDLRFFGDALNFVLIYCAKPSSNMEPSSCAAENFTELNVTTAMDMQINLSTLFTCVLFVLINAAVFGGNCLVVLAVLTTQRLQNVTNMYVVSLAIADLFVSLFVLPLAIHLEMKAAWTLGPSLCRVWITLDILLCTASILNLCIISLDRYLAVTRPLHYATQRSKRSAGVMIVLVWLLSVLVTLPPLWGWSAHVMQGQQCTMSRNIGYRIYSTSVSFLLPFLIMTFVYVRIFAVARQRRKLVRSSRPQSINIPSTSGGNKSTKNSSNSTNNVQRTQDSSTEDIGPVKEKSTAQKPMLRRRAALPGTVALSVMLRPTGTMVALTMLTSSGCTTNQLGETYIKNDKENRKRERAAFNREHKTAKTLAVVVGCFTFCWIPFFTMYLAQPFLPCARIHPIVVTVITWLGYINSVFNPFIYAFYNHEYAAAFKRILTCRFCR